MIQNCNDWLMKTKRLNLKLISNSMLLSWYVDMFRNIDRKFRSWTSSVSILSTGYGLQLNCTPRAWNWVIGCRNNCPFSIFLKIDLQWNQICCELNFSIGKICPNRKFTFCRFCAHWGSSLRKPKKKQWLIFKNRIQF